MANQKQLQDMTSGISLCAALFFVLTATLFSGVAHAQTVTFTYKLTCDVGSPGCPSSNLRLATQVGQVSSDTVAMATVNSDVPGYTQPVPINGGSLSWTSTPATAARCLSSLPPGLSQCQAAYGNPGGNASIVGSVFGLPKGSSLLASSFFGGATSEADNNLGEFIGFFTGSIEISYINPAILANLGMAGLPNQGSGVLSDEFYEDYSGPHKQLYGVGHVHARQCQRDSQLHERIGRWRTLCRRDYG